MQDLSAAAIDSWLHDARAVHVSYPNTAKVIVDWIQNGMPDMTTEFVQSVWDSVKVEHI
jgi:hypothetical protein